MDLCLKHNIDCFMNLVGSRTQFSVSYSSALLVPCWQLYVFLCTCRAGCLDNVVLCSSVDVLKGWLDSFSSWLPQCWGLPVKQLGGFPSFAPCLEHVSGGGVV